MNGRSGGRESYLPVRYIFSRIQGFWHDFYVDIEFVYLHMW